MVFLPVAGLGPQAQTLPEQLEDEEGPRVDSFVLLVAVVGVGGCCFRYEEAGVRTCLNYAVFVFGMFETWQYNMLFGILRLVYICLSF